jgi:TetR/AcrR family transcriptional regulator, transcriptional repressor for nem operon
VVKRLEPKDGDNTLQGPAEPLRAYINSYLSAGHVVHADSGCPMAAVGSEASHAGAKVSAAFAEGANEIVGRLTEGLAEVSPMPRETAIRLLSSLVGTIVVARAVGAGSLQDEIIAAVRADPMIVQALGTRTN